MPIYVYRCEDCSSEFEIKRSFGESSVVPCPRCQGRTNRRFSPVPIIFKGSGFYVTDSRKNRPTPEETGESR